MIEGLSQQQIADECGAKIRTLKKWLVEKHRLAQEYRKENLKLGDVQHDLLIGSMLGDGHIDKRETQPLFIVSHAENQKDYLYWKYETMKNLCNIPPREFENKGTYESKQRHCKFSTRIHYCLKEYRTIDIKGLIDELSEFSLSVYVLDDGHRDKSRWSICVARFEQDEKEYFIESMKNDFNLEAYIMSDSRYIAFTSDSSRLLDKIILKNIPNHLDIVKYKILEKYICKPANYRYIKTKEGMVGANTFSRKNNLKYEEVVRLYDSGIKTEYEIVEILK